MTNIVEYEILTAVVTILTPYSKLATCITLAFCLEYI